jgi:hypothetical protein
LRRDEPSDRSLQAINFPEVGHLDRKRASPSQLLYLVFDRCNLAG